MYYDVACPLCFFRYTLRNYLTGSCRSSNFRYLLCLHIDFHSDYTTLHSHQCCITAILMTHIQYFFFLFYFFLFWESLEKFYIPLVFNFSAEKLYQIIQNESHHFVQLLSQSLCQWFVHRLRFLLWCVAIQRP